MRNVSESGHAKNIANFERLFACIRSHGEVYKPVDERLSAEAVELLWEQAQVAHGRVNDVLSAHRASVNARFEAFKPLQKLITQISRMMVLMSVSEKSRASAHISVRKLQGRRASVRLNSEDVAALVAEGKPVPVQVSAAQTGYDDKLNYLEQLIGMLEITPEYEPNETHLTTKSLRDLLDLLKTHNSLVKYSEVDLRRARTERNRLLYSPLDGVCEVAHLVKMYLYVVFGRESVQYREVVALKFSRLRYSPVNEQAVIVPSVPKETDATEVVIDN